MSFPQIGFVDWNDRSDLWGRKIANQYQVERLIGSGNVGLVFEVKRISDDATFALKTLRPNYAFTNDHIQRFCREIQVGYHVRHPAILSVLDHGRLPDGTPFFITRKLQGSSLRSWIKKNRRLPTLFVAEVAMKVASALIQVHQHGFVHRDIKPEHIWIDNENIHHMQVKIIDFGVCTSSSISDLEKRREKGLVFGTPNYVSPEQALGNPEVGPVSDVFSLGVTLFEALTGRLPYPSTPHENVLAQILRGQYLPLNTIAPHIPSQMSQAIEQCLQKDPHKRFQSAKDFMVQMEQLIAKLQPDFSLASAG